MFASPQTVYPNWYDVKNAYMAAHGLSQVTAKEVLASEMASQLTKFKEGKSTTSIFDPVLCELAYRWHTVPGDRVLDPWAGGSVRGIVAGSLGRHYTGIDLREEQVVANKAQAGIVEKAGMGETPVTPEWITGDSTAVLSTLDGEYDMLIGCPPYYDLEKYSDDPLDLSTMKPADFDAAMIRNIEAAARLLKNDRFAVMVVGAVRDKKGHILDMRRCMTNAFNAAGMNLLNDAILLNAVGSAATRASRSFQAARTLARVHQEVLVFVKGDRKKAATRLGDVDIRATLEISDAVESTELEE